MEEVKARHNEIIELEKNITTMHEIFADLQTLVDQQVRTFVFRLVSVDTVFVFNVNLFASKCYVFKRIVAFCSYVSREMKWILRYNKMWKLFLRGIKSERNIWCIFIANQDEKMF